jgi:hypothetical protein
MLFTYRCIGPHHGEPHEFDQNFAPGRAPDDLVCMKHRKKARRHFSAASMPQMKFDPFRAHHLSTRKESAQVEQQRVIDAPESAQEARELGKATGRQYVGDDTSGMTKSAQRGVENQKWIDRDKKRKIVAVT